MISKIINGIWTDLINEVNLNPNKFSGEKSIVFNFAWRLSQNLQSRIKNIDFEKQTYDCFSDGQYLDLYFEIDDIKIGIEFKYPKSTKNNKENIKNSGNSNQTQTRIKVINDIKRLSHLVNLRKIDYGVFLMLTNEKPYVHMGNRKTIAANFKTYQNTHYKSGEIFPIDMVKSRDEVSCPIDIGFNWNGMNNNILFGNVAWIDPIILQNANALDSQTTTRTS
jgi:hypothetical protein